MTLGSIIPTLDMANHTPEEQTQIIKHALGSVGFFAVANAGPKTEDIAALFDHSRNFFGLSMEKKEEYLAGRSGSGYTKLLSQALGEGKRDHKETFSYGKYCQNQTQAMPPPFDKDEEAHEVIKRFYQDCHDVSERLMELFALALELPAEHFRQWHSFGLNTAMSLIHYPAVEAESQAKLGDMDIRAGEHKDWGTMTLLFQQPTGQPGLQVHLPRSAIYDDPSLSGFEWYPGPIPPPGGFLVNVGLGMELWSSGMYRATLHRVIFPEVTEEEREAKEGYVDRDTLAFFVQPDDDVQFQPILPGGKIDTSVKAITSGELFDMKLRESMDRFKETAAKSAAILAGAEKAGAPAPAPGITA
ncbi:hypothetical protein IAT38_005013 [Cryptococcus sp. DSM 104549]